MITVDGGGSNGWRLRLWKHEFQKFSDEFGISVIVSHFPPGTSKWNKIEQRLFSFISSNWRGEPLIDYETIVNLIAGTKTAKGLKVICRLDHAEYPTGIIVSDNEMKCLNVDVQRDFFEFKGSMAFDSLGGSSASIKNSCFSTKRERSECTPLTHFC